ncbi:GlxA family transcriptional regulator [Halomonas nitroreducens]|uniref:Helix-turn-helix domain-containing protein n=1 Tax=Halomonas nitroreducens TaxID=447425 RepID=A0A431V731_9GAMM|nr:helix-turn-helix domain-containing protein [Halomonas nitroreducens]RTR06453.1 helix-turn-helix domain-containing protein [Halomonas nitroreducens]
MKPILPSPPPPLSVNILLFDTFSNMLLACLLEPLRVVRDEASFDIEWTILTHGDEPLRSSSGLSIAPDRPVAQAQPCHLLLMIGGDHFRIDADDPGLRRSLRLTRNAESVIAADTGPWLLATLGYLSGRQVTLHWQLLAEFAETFPDVTTLSDRYVRDGRWLTCGSAATALELMLEEIASRFGPAARFDAAAMFLNDTSRDQTATPPFGDLLPHGHPKVRKIVNLMAAHIESPLTLPQLASAADITLRSMARLFEAEMGMTPGRYYQHMRLTQARDLAAQTQLSLDQIALRCGLSCGSALSRAYSRAYGRRLRDHHRDETLNRRLRAAGAIRWG